MKFIKDLASQDGVWHIDSVNYETHTNLAINYVDDHKIKLSIVFDDKNDPYFVGAVIEKDEETIRQEAHEALENVDEDVRKKILDYFSKNARVYRGYGYEVEELL